MVHTTILIWSIAKNGWNAGRGEIRIATLLRFFPFIFLVLFGFWYVQRFIYAMFNILSFCWINFLAEKDPHGEKWWIYDDITFGY